MLVDTANLSLENPVFRTHALAASIMIMKLMLQPWMTVVRMIKAGGGFRSPEDAKKSPLNPKARPPSTYRERIRGSLSSYQPERFGEHSRLSRGGIAVGAFPSATAACPNIDLDLRSFASGAFRCLCDRATTRYPSVLLDLGIAFGDRVGRSGERDLKSKTKKRDRTFEE